MDFDDLLYYTNVLMRDFPEVLHYYQHKFKYILVDEYQDTNYAQYLIIKKLLLLMKIFALLVMMLKAYTHLEEPILKTY